MTIDFVSRTIVLTKKEMTAARRFGSDAYKELQAARRDNEAQDLRTYRIDRMRDVRVLDEKQNKKLEWTAIKDMKAYMRQTFSMFGGEKKKVEMRFDNTLLDTVIDKFGVGFGAEYSADGENHFIVTTDVTVSDQFYAWVCGFGTKVKIVAPEDLAKNYKEYLCHISGIY